ncbi:MAG: diguanylate cyclase [Oceanospirillaceae bacterium]
MIKVFSDFSCPFCFVQYHRIQQAQFKQSIEYCFIEHAPQIVTNANTQAQLALLDEEFAIITRRATDIKINKPTFCVNTHLATLHYFSLLMIDAPKAQEFATLVYNGYWLHNQDISNQAILWEYLKQIGQDHLEVDVLAIERFRKDQHFWINGDMDKRIPAMRSVNSDLLLGLHDIATITAYIQGDQQYFPTRGEACTYAQQQTIALIDLVELNSIFASLSSDYQVSNYNSVQDLFADEQRHDISTILIKINANSTADWRPLSLLKQSPLFNQYLPVMAIVDKNSNLMTKQGFLLGAIDVLALETVNESILPCINNRISNYRTLNTLANYALVDGLTGVLNKRAMMDVLQRNWRKSCRNKTQISIILLDVDDFKPYNDIYGHLEGDNCLKHLAAIFTGQLNRPDDIVSRFGGEEFCLVLPETGSEGAKVVIKHIQAALKTNSIEHRGSTVANSQHVTVSFGVVSAVANADGNVIQMLELADKALYQAKRNGKNTASFA